MFSKLLIYWYLENKRDLPWRKKAAPYAVWLSEIILQQTKVSQGLAYYLAFIEEFPTVFDLAKASEEKILKMWQGLGYYSRARNLHFSAKYIANELEGVFPENYTNIKKLKGVGDYTASAIASICFNEASAVVDGNVYRVLSRYFGIATPINSTKGIKEFKTLAQELISTEEPGTHNQAIMEFGALHCKPKKPLCLSCVLENSCVANEKNQIDLLPVKEKKLKIKKRYFNYLVIADAKGEVIIQQRTGKGIWQNLYELPLIETEKKINIEDLYKEKILQDLKYKKSQISLFNEQEIIHKLTHQHIYTSFWIIDANPFSSWKNTTKYPFPTLVANFLENWEKLNP